jgi:hypothetical protein
VRWVKANPAKCAAAAGGERVRGGGGGGDQQRRCGRVLPATCRVLPRPGERMCRGLIRPALHSPSCNRRQGRGGGGAWARAGPAAGAAPPGAARGPTQQEAAAKQQEARQVPPQAHPAAPRPGRGEQRSATGAAQHWHCRPSAGAAWVCWTAAVCDSAPRARPASPSP